MKTNPATILLTILITALVAGGGVYYWQENRENPQTETENSQANSEDSKTEVAMQNSTQSQAEPEAKFKSLLYKGNYSIPFGAAEIEGYYTTVNKRASLDDSAPEEACSAFVITDGPSELLSYLKVQAYGDPRTVVIGSKNSSWGGNLKTSTKENPVKLLVTLDTTFEGETIGCTSWPFRNFVEIK